MFCFFNKDFFKALDDLSDGGPVMAPDVWFWDADLDQGMAFYDMARASGNDMAANYIVLMISIGSYINNKFIDPTIILNN